MTRSIAEVQRELRALLARGVPLEFRPQGPLASQPLRQSAVLMLFGARDRMPVATPTRRTVPAQLDVLLTRRAAHMRHHPGQIAFPGGGSEPGDSSPAETALRESAEETGLDPEGVEVLGALPEVHVPVSNNLVTPVVGWWRRPSDIAADRAESVEVFRVPVSELLDPAARGTSVLRRAGQTHRGAAFRLGRNLGGRVVWGFTGILLATLFDELDWSIPWDATREFPVEP